MLCAPGRCGGSRWTRRRFVTSAHRCLQSSCKRSPRGRRLPRSRAGAGSRFRPAEQQSGGPQSTRLVVVPSIRFPRRHPRFRFHASKRLAGRPPDGYHRPGTDLRFVAIGIVRSVSGQMTKALAGELLAFRATEGDATAEREMIAPAQEQVSHSPPAPGQLSRLVRGDVAHRRTGLAGDLLDREVVVGRDGHRAIMRT